jgi:LysM repeat protein
MKASILDHDTPVATSPTTAWEPRQRAHLVLVPTGPAARGSVAPQEPVAMRLTSFGRLVVSVLAAAALALLLSAFAGSLASASGEAKEITVQAGQTLSEIAAKHLPDLSVRDAVVELQILNGLSTSQIHAGQTLRVPSP